MVINTLAFASGLGFGWIRWLSQKVAYILPQESNYFHAKFN